MKSTIRGVIAYVALIVLTGLIAGIISTNAEKEKNKIIDYLNENSEDEISIVAIQKTESDRKGYKYYFAWTIDSDGDYEMLVVEINDGKMESYEVEWK